MKAHCRDTQIRHQGENAYIALVHLCIPQGLLYWFHGLAEQVHVELLKARTCDAAVEVLTLVQAVNLNAGLRCTAEGALGALTGCVQPPQGARIATDVLLVFPLELLQCGCRISMVSNARASKSHMQ